MHEMIRFAEHLRALPIFRNRFRRYRVGRSEVSRQEIESKCLNASKILASQGLTNAFSDYQKLVAHLRSERKYSVCPLKHFRPTEKSEGKIIIGLRHDVDDDIVSALRCARHLARYGMPGTFYLLHISHYYGYFEDSIFLRHVGLEDLIRDLVVTGNEIGLHIDPLSLYCQFGIDGKQAVLKELNWLRSIGAEIVGTSAHNSAPVFGAENFEVFKGRAFDSRKKLIYKDKRIPLQTIDEAHAGLHYEANFPIPGRNSQHPKLYNLLAPPPPDAIRSRDWLQSYMIDNPMFERAYDVSIWPVGKDAWFFAKHSGQPQLFWPLSFDQMISRLETLGAGNRVIFNIHPEYVSG